MLGVHHILRWDVAPEQQRTRFASEDMEDWLRRPFMDYIRRDADEHKILQQSIPVVGEGLVILNNNREFFYRRYELWQSRSFRQHSIFVPKGDDHLHDRRVSAAADVLIRYGGLPDLVRSYYTMFEESEVLDLTIWTHVLSHGPAGQESAVEQLDRAFWTAYEQESYKRAIHLMQTFQMSDFLERYRTQYLDNDEVPIYPAPYFYMFSMPRLNELVRIIVSKACGNLQCPFQWRGSQPCPLPPRRCPFDSSTSCDCAN